MMAAGPVLNMSPLRLWAWWLWDGGLVVAGLGLVLCAAQAWASPMVAVVGSVFIVQAIALAGAMVGSPMMARAYQLLAVPKVATVGLLAITEWGLHGRHRCVWLLVAGVVGTIKISWRTFAADHTTPVLVDIAVTQLLAAALIVLALGMRRRESEWAVRRLADSSASFEDFNRLPTPESRS